MKTIDLSRQQPDIAELLELADGGPVLLITSDGREFMLSEADDFEQEVAALRQSAAFQRFLDERAASPDRVPLEKIERRLDAKSSGG
jgi:hypothetical protein